MRIIFAKDKNHYYELNFNHQYGERKIWLAAQDGEGGTWDIDVIMNVLYDALDKFHKENF